MSAEPDGHGAAVRSRRAWVALLLILVFAAGIRWRLRDMPLERDEGEFAYGAQSMLRGVPPYREVYNKKFPGVSAAYAVFLEVFGETPAGIHLGTLLVNAAAIVLVFLLARRLWDAAAGVFAAATYALLSLDPGALGLAGHASHFVVLAALAGLLVLLRGLEGGRLRDIFAAGLLLGVSVLMKQPGIVFVGVAALWTLVLQADRRPIRWGRLTAQLAVLGAGSALPVVAMALGLWWAGVFRRFWFWTFVYAREYGYVPLASAPALLCENFGYLVARSHPIWMLVGIALVLAFLDVRARRQAVLVALLLVGSFVGTSFGLIYRNHYFILLMPAAALFVGAGMTAFRTRSTRLALAALFGGMAAWTIWAERDVFFLMTPLEVSRALYGTNPFIESAEVARYLAAHTAPDEKIAVLGSEAQILFYAKRPSATGYIYVYGLMQDQPYAIDMQREMAAEIEAARPRYMVLVHVTSSWLGSEDSPRWLEDWLRQYALGFDQVGFVELTADGARYLWDAAARSHRPESPTYLLILRRKDDAGTTR